MLLLWALLGCTTASFEPDARTVVLLVSWDTTRADALGAYGNARARTPNADAIAARGVRFEWALTQAPTTLNAHTSLFTGLDPHAHGVVRNGYALEGSAADGPPLLAERFQAGGWDTVAVVGATALDHSMGLARGFRVYDDLPLEEQNYEHDAKRVTDRAIARIEARDPTRPLFLFVHYYDAHSPWTSAPPELQRQLLGSYRGRVTGTNESITEVAHAFRAGTLDPSDAQAARALYLADVAWADVQLGRLLGALEGFDHRLVALVADHGESLDDPGTEAYGHGEDVDLVAIRIPFLLSGTGVFHLPAGTVVHRQVRLMDVGTTLAGIAGLGPLGEGEDLRPLWNGEDRPAPPAFAEATKPLAQERKTGWNNLGFERAVARDGLLWIDRGGNDGVLYGLDQDQPRVEDAARARMLEAELRAWDEKAPAFRPGQIDPALIEGLRALGYVQ